MSEKKIILAQEKSSDIKKFDVAGEIIVPDIKPDIVTIIDTNANVYIYKQEISKGRIKVGGNIDTYINYISDSGDTRSIQTTLDFSEIIDDEKITESSKLITSIKLENLETKILNERKISIIATTMFKYEVFENDEVTIKESFDELDRVQVLSENKKVTSLIGENSIKATISEELKPSSEGEIAEIVKVNLNIQNPENKISYNKVLAKAEANVEILYLSENGAIEKLSGVIPVMNFIDIPNITEEDRCVLKYNLRNMLIKINSREINSISFQADFEIQCFVYHDENVLFTKDIYSLTNEIELEKNVIQVSAEGEEETISVSENINIPEVLKIYSIDIIPKIITNTKIGDSISYEGELNVGIYYKSNSNNLNYINAKIPFIKQTSKTILDTDLEIKNITYSLNSENLLLEVDVLIKSRNNENEKIEYVNNIIIKDETSKNDYNMYLYFVKNGDTIWNIAKKFKVTMQDIIDINNLEEPDKINIGDKLYIMK